MTMQFDRAEFKAYLEKFPTVPFATNSACYCPLACWLKFKHKAYVEVRERNTVIRYGMEVYHATIEPTPAWMSWFICRFDRPEPSHRTGLQLCPPYRTGATALEILETIPPDEKLPVASSIDIVDWKGITP